MWNSQSLCHIIAWSALATCFILQGESVSRLVINFGEECISSFGMGWQSNTLAYHQGGINQRALKWLTFSNGNMFSFFVLIRFCLSVIWFFFPATSCPDGSFDSASLGKVHSHVVFEAESLKLNSIKCSGQWHHCSTDCCSTRHHDFSRGYLNNTAWKLK